MTSEVDMTLDERVSIGKVNLPFSLTNKKVLIYDENEQPIFEIIGSSIQCQLCFFSLPVGPCKEAVFYIVNYR